MLSPDRVRALERAMRNIAVLLMAAMMETMGGVMGELSQALHDAFAAPDSTRDVAAEIRTHMTEEQVRLFEELDSSPDPVVFDRVVTALDDASADELLAPLRVSIEGLPPLTESLSAEAMAGYLHLLQRGDGVLDASVGAFAARVQELAEPRSLSDLSAGGAAQLSQAAGREIRLTIDPSCGEGTGISPTIALVTRVFQHLSAWEDWTKRRLARMEEVRVRNVATPEQAGWSLQGNRLDLAVCLAEGTEPPFSNWDLAEAITEQWKREAVEERVAARGARAIPGEGGFTVETAGVQIVAPVAREEESDLRPFSSSPGTSIALVARRSAQGITRFVSESSTIQSAVDDRGGDLLHDWGPSGTGAGFHGFPAVRADGSACLLEIGLPGIPAAGATRLDLDLVLAFEIANGQDEVAADVIFKRGTVIELGGIRLEVVNVDPEWGFQVDLRSGQPLDAVAGYRFFARDGREIPCRVSSSFTSGWSDSVVEERTLSFEEPAPEGRLVLVVWKNRDTVTFPIRVPVQLGL